MPRADRLVWPIAGRQYGMFSHAQAVAAGVSPSTIQRRVDDGSWLRHGHAVYAIGGAPLNFESHVMAAILDAGEAFASHRTAAYLHGLDGFAARTRVEVVIFDRRGISIPGVTVHRPRIWLPEDKSETRRIPVTSVARSLFDLAATCRRREVEVAFDDALRRGLVSIETIVERLERVRRPGVPGLSRVAALVADRLTNPMEDSELEAMFRKLLEQAGLPAPVAQNEVRRDDGSLVAEVDFAYPQIRLAIELDSWTYHGGRSPFEGDRVKQYELYDAGWDCLRFTKSDLRRRSNRVISVIARRLAMADPSGTRERRMAVSNRPRRD